MCQVNQNSYEFYQSETKRQSLLKLEKLVRFFHYLRYYYHSANKYQLNLPYIVKLVKNRQSHCKKGDAKVDSENLFFNFRLA